MAIKTFIPYRAKFTGVVPPLGYQKDPEEKEHLLIDDETAPIVRKIFQWVVDGHETPPYLRIAAEYGGFLWSKTKKWVTKN